MSTARITTTAVTNAATTTPTAIPATTAVGRPPEVLPPGGGVVESGSVESGSVMFTGELQLLSKYPLLERICRVMDKMIDTQGIHYWRVNKMTGRKNS